jgi:hypothetical protein
MVSVNYPVHGGESAHPHRVSSIFRVRPVSLSPKLTPSWGWDTLVTEYSNASVFNTSGICTCTANCTKSAVGSRQKCNMCKHPGEHPFLQIIRTAPGPDGPWTETLSSVMGNSDSNLACWINGSGAVNCNGRGGGIYAFSLDWHNFSSWVDFDHDPTTLFVSSRPDQEDPMLWQDVETGVWHSIQHNLQGPHMCEGQLCQVGAHQFSLDGRGVRVPYPHRISCLAITPLESLETVGPACRVGLSRQEGWTTTQYRGNREY